MTVRTSSELHVGTYRWDLQGWRRWSGRQWVEATCSAFPQRLTRPRDWATYPELDRSDRDRLLEQAVEREVRAGGRVVERGDDAVTLAYRRTVTHLGHAVLTLMTFGLWAVVWAAVALSERESRVRYEVDAWGNVWPVSPQN